MLCLNVDVTNTGTVSGKEVVQAYVEAPQGALGKPARVLVGYAKTGVIEPKAVEQLNLEIPFSVFASFDDSGATGHKNCYVLEAGEYRVYVGSDVRSAALAESFTLDFTVVEELKEAYAPAEAFERMRPAEDGSLTYEVAPLRTVGPYDCMEMPEEILYTGDQGYRLSDVYEQKVSM